MRKSVGKAPTAGKQTQQKPCRTSSDTGAELENHIVGRGPTLYRKGLTTGLQMVKKFKPVITPYLFTLCRNKQLCIPPALRTRMRLCDSRKKYYLTQATLSGWSL
jgi:hypothetical protein